MNDVALTIIVPVYNVENYLRDCIDSILKNDFVDYELILIDDGSSDRSPVICDEYAKKDARIKAIHQQNSGQSVARNVGLDIARGKYISFIDSDDKVSYDLYSVNMSILLGNPSIDVLEFPVDVDVQRGDINVRQDIQGHKEILNYWINVIKRTVVWCRIYKKEIFNQLRFPAGMIYEDTYVTPSLARKINHLYVSDQGMYHYNTSNISTMRCPITKIKILDRLEADFKILEQRFLYWPDAQRTIEAYYSYCMKYYVYRKIDPFINCEKYKQCIREYMPSCLSIYRCGLTVKAKAILLYIKIFRPENLTWMLKIRG